MQWPRTRKELVRHPLFLAYFDLYCRHRALIATLVARGLVPPERFEDEATMWARAHRATLLDEALDWFWDYVVERSSGGPVRDQPPPDRPTSP